MLWQEALGELDGQIMRILEGHVVPNGRAELFEVGASGRFVATHPVPILPLHPVDLARELHHHELSWLARTSRKYAGAGGLSSEGTRKVHDPVGIGRPPKLRLGPQ